MKDVKALASAVTVILLFGLFAVGAHAANLLDGRDPGFEQSASNGTYPSSGYWQRAWLGSAGAVCTSTAAYSGGCGLWEYTGSGTTEWWSGQYQDISALPGEIYSASAWVRSQSSWVSGSKALVRVSFLSGSRSEITAKDSAAITSGSGSWQQLSVQTDRAPSGTAYVRIRLYLEKPNGSSGQSIANFDDCYIERTSTPVPNLSVSPMSLGFGSDLTSLTFDIKNTGDGTLTWSVAKNAGWLSVSPSGGTTTTETDTVTVTVSRIGLKLPNYSDTLQITSDGGNKQVGVFMETVPPQAVPAQPSIVTVNGYQLMVQRRLPNGTLDIARPYIIKGAAWSPAGIGTTSAFYSRRAAFGDWYRLDIQMLKEMNANTVYFFLDPGTDATTIATATAVLDYCYQNGMMAVMTVDENGTDNVANIAQVINAYKNHPAILMWALGNEWNLWRPDRPLYYEHYSTLAAAATEMQANALRVKALDTTHPVASILGEINYPTQADVSNIVNNVCTAVDVWGANIYRGPEFYALFTEWKSFSSKPLFLSEFGTDAFHSSSWWPVAGAENQVEQADYLNTLWLDMAQELSANDPAKVCLGGTVFEWNDEWWKTSTGSATDHDPGGYETTWNPIAHPDGFANEEWFGVVSVDRERRQAYYTLQNDFSYVLRLTVPARAKESYSSAAACEMILDYIRQGLAADLSQTEIYAYGHFYNLAANGGLAEMDPMGASAALGHFDPYDTSDPSGFGNPYNAYNYGVESFPSSDASAFRSYLRDICHWMDYQVPTTYMGQTLVSKPNSPAMVPMFGDYGHWVIVNGFSTSQDPLPLSGTNPWYTPDFVVNGLWITDPAVGGIGYDTYKTSAECENTYFKPLVTSDQYNGAFVQIAEPPPYPSKADIEIPAPAQDVGNLKFVGAAPQKAVVAPAAAAAPSMAKMSMALRVPAVPALPKKPAFPPFVKKSWRDLVDPVLLNDPVVVLAFEGAKRGTPVLVKRPDAVNRDYYLAPFNRRSCGQDMASGVIALDAVNGYFKEAAWTRTPEKLIKVDRVKALALVRKSIIDEISAEIGRIPRKPMTLYMIRALQVIQKYSLMIRSLGRAKAELVWQPAGYSPSPFQPYWKIALSGVTWHVTQDGKVIK